MCFLVGDPFIQTTCSLSGMVEYTPLGLDGYWLSMVSNGKLFKWLWHHILNIHFSENISTIYPCIHWPVMREWTHKFMSYITKQETFQWNSSTAHPDGSHVGWGINSLLLEFFKLFYDCIILTIRHGFSYLTLQWCTSFPPILSRPSFWQWSYVWFWNV